MLFEFFVIGIQSWQNVAIVTKLNVSLLCIIKCRNAHNKKEKEKNIQPITPFPYLKRSVNECWKEANQKEKKTQFFVVARYETIKRCVHIFVLSKINSRYTKELYNQCMYILYCIYLNCICICVCAVLYTIIIRCYILFASISCYIFIIYSICAKWRENS